MNTMEPLTVLAWVGVIAVSAILIAITALCVWAVVQTMRGKPLTIGRP